MSENKGPAAGVAIFKDLVAALRDGVLFVVFVLLFAFPAMIKGRLEAAGFTEGSVLGFGWKTEVKSAAEQTRAVGQTVSQAKQSYEELEARLRELEAQVSQPAAKRSLEEIQRSVTETRNELVAADRTARQSLSVQQDIVARIEPAAIPTTGWIYLGKVNSDRTAWDPTVPQTARAGSLPLQPGTPLSIRDDVYLRADSAPGARATAEILSVLRVGEAVEVVEVDYSRARAGGWFVWAKVRRRV